LSFSAGQNDKQDVPFYYIRNA